MTEAIRQAGRMLMGLDPQVLTWVRVSLTCSLAATALAVVLGVPLAVALGRRRFPGRRALLLAAHMGMTAPTVVIGLVLYALLSRSGPLGRLGSPYTQEAIILCELCLALPMTAALFSSAAMSVDGQLEKTARTLGAGPLRTGWLIVREARTGLVAATMAVFGRVVSELGIAMVVGGSILSLTRTMTTAMVLETQKGDLALSLALGLVLLTIALIVNAAAQAIRLPA